MKRLFNKSLTRSVSDWRDENISLKLNFVLLRQSKTRLVNWNIRSHSNENFVRFKGFLSMSKRALKGHPSAYVNISPRQLQSSDH